MITKFRSIYKTPLGTLQIEAEDGFITEIKFLEADANSSDNKNTSAVIKSCLRELEEYFNRTRKIFSIPLKLEGTEFEKQVWNELRNIPYGKTITYEELASRLGDVKKIRAAGRASGKNPLPIIVPCHRVIGKDGSFVGYAGGIHRKEWLLAHEGAINKQVSIFDFSVS